MDEEGNYIDEGGTVLKRRKFDSTKRRINPFFKKKLIINRLTFYIYVIDKVK